MEIMQFVLNLMKHTVQGFGIFVHIIISPFARVQVFSIWKDIKTYISFIVIESICVKLNEINSCKHLILMNRP